MRIRALTTMAGVGWSAFPGDVVDVPRAEAQPIIDAGYAEEIRQTPRTAEAMAPERQAVAPEPEGPAPKTKRKGRARR